MKSIQTSVKQASTLREVSQLQKETQEQRPGPEKGYERAFALFPCMLCKIDFDNYIVSANPFMCKTFGFCADKLTPKPYLPYVHPEDLQNTEKKLAALKKEFAAVSFENRCLCEGGIYRSLLWSIVSSPPERLLYCIAQDITDYKHTSKVMIAGSNAYSTLENQMPNDFIVSEPKAIYMNANPKTRKLIEDGERFLYSIFTSIQDGISILDSEFNIVWVNPVMEKWYSSSAPLIGKKCYEAYHRRSKHCPECISLKTLNTGKPAYAQAPITDLDGKIIGWTEDYCFPLVDSQTGKIQGVIQYIRDVTEKVNMKQEMARLDRLDLVGGLAASIGHEVRNPMTTVRGFLQFLRNKPECSKYANHFDLMITEMDRANSIISEFLSLAKNKTVELKIQNLNTIIKAFYPLLLANAMNSEKDIRLQLGELPDLPLDQNEIRQLLLNLVCNGLEAMPPGRILTISTYTEGDEVVLSVQDQGSGIEPHLLEKIGTPFFTTKEGGTGLGLAVCYSIAARHNASIKVETSPSGTTFFVRFKLN